MTKKEKIWLGAICEYGCIVCQKKFNIFSPASPHHIEGRTKKGADLKTIPLCGGHHQTGGNGVAFHETGKKTWEAKYGNQYELLEELRGIINA